MKKERSRKYGLIRASRILVQVVFFALFLYLLFGTHYTGQDYIGGVEAFFHFDPLLALATSIASRIFFASFILAAFTLILTVVLGRVACGWVCPMGSIHQFFSAVFKKTRFLKPRAQEKGSLAWKYYLLIFILVGSLFTLDLVGLFDPLSLLYRSFATSVVPVFAKGFSALIGLFYPLHLTTAGDKLSQFFENLTINQTFRQGFFIGLLFLGTVLLNAAKERFWCRYLCPLGAFLGLFSRWNVLKLKIDPEKCIKCGLCNVHCETQASPYPNEAWRSSECVYCFTCGAICPTSAISFPLAARPEKINQVDLSRRKLILTSLVAFVAAPLFRISPAARRAHEKLIRPPGALPERQFLEKCVKCGECMKACPTNALQPASTEAGPEGLWTPVLIPKVGYCEYYCSLCTQVCPTGAIKELTIEEKIKVRIGTAWINKNQCIPYALGRPCIVCEEHCPTSPKAIKFIMTDTKLPDGTVKTQKAPVIDLNLCIGCGICENKCPVVDDPAVYVTSVGEQRSEQNQLLLPVAEEPTETQEKQNPEQ